MLETITQKKCSTCKELKLIQNFNLNARMKDGFNYSCKQCKAISDSESHDKYKDQRNHNKKLYIRTINVMISQIYLIQKNKSVKRGHKPPEYTKEQLIEWFYKQDNFQCLYNNWVNSGYKTDIKPSVDRIRNNDGYSFDNIRLVTWHENNHKEFENKKNGINNDFSKSIIQYTLDMEFVKEHYSIRNASRELKCLHSGIMRCCKGRQKYAHGYIWRYKDS